jgi:hypothetical protein
MTNKPTGIPEDNIDEQTQTLLEYCVSNKRVCPLPKQWNTLWELLPGRHRSGSSWEPSLPLILAAWSTSSDGMKRSRLKEHILWAQSHGYLLEIENFLTALPEIDWYHAGD